MKLKMRLHLPSIQHTGCRTAWPGGLRHRLDLSLGGRTGQLSPLPPLLPPGLPPQASNLASASPFTVSVFSLLASLVVFKIRL